MTSAAPVTKKRIESIDILRGLIMLIMALDHVRDFFQKGNPSPLNMQTTTVILFFSRWITHYCAPNFVFLSGVSSYLAGTRRTKNELTSFLIKRGLWLILIELVVMSFALTLDPAYSVIVLQVIFVIGFSMVLLGLLIWARASLTVIGVIGALIFFGHDIFDLVPLPAAGAGNVLMRVFFTAQGTVFPIGSGRIVLDLYAVIPWTGVMLLGYCTGSMYQSSFDPQRRRKILRIGGIALILLFIVLRYSNVYGDPAPWAVQRNAAHTVLSFLSTSKYPPSLLFLCMTIGPALVALSLLEGVKNKFSSILIVYGNVPFFYYILHFYLIRILNIIIFFVSGYNVHQIVNPGQIFLFQPPGFGFTLAGAYLIWLLLIIALYLPCRWYSKYKRTHTQWWLSYL